MKYLMSISLHLVFICVLLPNGISQSSIEKNKEFEILSKCSDLSSYVTKYNSEFNLDCKADYSIDKQREILNNL